MVSSPARDRRAIAYERAGVCCENWRSLCGRGAALSRRRRRSR